MPLSIKISTLLIVLWFFQACNTARLPYFDDAVDDWEEKDLPTEKPLHTFFLVGNTGASSRADDLAPSLQILKSDLEQAPPASSLVFLGNNVAPQGLSGKDDPNRKTEEQQLTSLFRLSQDYAGKTFFLPGRTDWKNGQPGGLKTVQRQERFIEDYFNKKFPDEKGDHFLPDDGCAGPEKEKISKDIVMLFVDSQWWLDDWKKEKKINEDCDIKTRLDYLEKLKEQINKHRNDHVIIMMHHPLYSRGPRGGQYAIRDHLLPVPGLGSLNLLRRNLYGNRQDINHPNYSRLKKEIEEILFEYEDIVFVSAHEYSLQHFRQNKLNHHFIISGGGSTKTNYAATGKPNRDGVEAHFVHASAGYAKIYIYKNQGMWLEFIKPGKNGQPAQVCYRQQLKRSNTPPEDFTPATPYAPIIRDSVESVASTEYETGKFSQLFLGDQYRKTWATPVKARVIDLSKEKGGLKPVQLGGGKASKTIRLVNEEGHQYVLRSLNKSVDKVTPDQIKNTFAQSYFQDQISGLHPYGALAIPILAEAAEIYHTNPELVYVPRQPAMSIYNKTFAESLYLFEERPDNDRSDIASFGNSKEIIGYKKLIPKLTKSPKHQVDQQWVLKSRIFDQFVHDWDRHDDQWRWASFEQEDGTTLYRPIPRDRDQTFYASRGLIPWIVSRNFVNRQTKTFKASLKDPIGQSWNSKWFNRYFLNEMSRQDWLAAARKLQENLTDEIIESAFEQWPKPIQDINAEEFIAKLKNRRDELHKYAEKLYEYQARSVDIRGTDKRELFEVERRPEGITEVWVYHVNKEREKKALTYHRVFYRAETKDINLYGLGGDDEFIIKGKSDRGSVIRIIGGDGMDMVKDDSAVSGLRKKTKVYDRPGGMVIESKGETKNLVSDRLGVNEYNRSQFVHNHYLPLPAFGANVDDGFFVGMGFTFWKYRFRKQPFANRQTISFNRATKSNAFNLNYNAHFVDLFGRIDFLPSVAVEQPSYFNFFGLGNETIPPTERTNFNQVRLEKVKVATLLGQSWRDQVYQISIGPYYERTRIIEQDNRISEDDEIFPDEIFQRQHYAGVRFTGSVNTVDAGKEGSRLDIFAEYRRNFTDEDNFATAGVSISTYATLTRKFPVTLALRLGSAHLLGGNNGLRFYDYQTLGNNNYLRGFRNNRYAGEQAIYGNTDIRVSLFYWKNRLIPFEFGLNGGYDIGRVWLNDNPSDEWHSVVTTGVWFSPFRLTVINAYYSFTNSRDDDTFTLRIGYFF